ncbi:MAG: hypothetical protein KAS48_04230 [Gammaproteobacteria bacterium]|nr:hypothetical protein [Gammaproteobacteria bacterium]
MLLKKNLIIPVLLTLLLFTCITVYFPGLSGDFVHDDYVNIAHNPYVKIEAITYDEMVKIFTNIHTGLTDVPNRAFARFTFSINYLLGGMDPYWFKLVNLIIHLLTGLAIYVASTLLLTAHQLTNKIPNLCIKSSYIKGISLLVAAVWLLHPLNVSTVMYVVQRMAQLPALFVMLAYIFYLKCRLIQIQGEEGSGHYYFWLAIGLFWPLALLSKENAIVFPALCWATEFTLLKFSKISGLIDWMFKGLYAVAIILIVYLIANPDFVLNTYTNRDYSLHERLLTQGRVIWQYIASLLIPNTAHMSLFLDDFPISTGITNPPETILSLCGVLLLLVFAFIFRLRFPIIAFGVLWFFIGHSIESSIFGLELAYEHRNYLPSIGLWISVVYSGALLFNRYKKIRRPIIFCVTSIYLVLAMQTYLRNTQWSSEVELAYTEATHHPKSFRANSELARQLIATGKYDLAKEFVGLALQSYRPYGNIYISQLVLNNIEPEKAGKITFDNIVHSLSSERVYISILPQLIKYISDAELNGWETPQQLIEITMALMRNPSMQGKNAQGNLHLILAKLYNDIEQQKKVTYHAKQAYSYSPDNVSIIKAYIHVLTITGEHNKARKLAEEMIHSSTLPDDTEEFIKLYKNIYEKEN